MTDEAIQPRNYTGVSTSDIVIEMLKENTGRGIGDSGDAYGRNWQRNAKKEFPDRPVVRASFSAWRKQGEAAPGGAEPHLSISLYHWMTGRLQFDAEMQQRLDTFAASEGEDMNYLELQEQFAQREFEAGNYAREPNTVNTYNNPNGWDCDQVLQYIEVYTEDGCEPSHLIVSVHGGCDVRGGYTAPKCFQLRREYSICLEGARVNCLSAGEMFWHYPDGCWRDCDTDAPIPDVMGLPCYDIQWLYDEPAVAEIAALIAAIPSQREALKQATWAPLWRELADDELTLSQARLQNEMFGASAKLLAERHEACTLVYERKLFLITGPSSVEEVKAHCDL
jgi:hypothetical protein